MTTKTTTPKKETFDSWQNLVNQWGEQAEDYTSMVFNTGQVALKQSVNYGEQMNKLTAETIKQTQALYAQEQEIVLQGLETWHNQVSKASEEMTKYAKLGKN